jgi:hypothetical protein
MDSKDIDNLQTDLNGLGEWVEENEMKANPGKGKIRTKKQRKFVCNSSFVNRTIKRWNQLPAGLLASFPCKLNTFRKRFMNAREFKCGLSVNK